MSHPRAHCTGFTLPNSSKTQLKNRRWKKKSEKKKAKKK
jgi:hypothetical protein